MIVRTPSARTLALSVLLPWWAASSAHAQPTPSTQPSPPEISQIGPVNNQVYGAAFFGQYSLTNAEDMLRRIPSVAVILDGSGTLSQARGLGASGDQILIDGKRMASKSTDVTAALRRIPASSVDRVELLRGTSSDTGVLSEGLVVNIFLREGANIGGGQGNFEINQRWSSMGWRDIDGLASYSNRVGALKYTLGAEKNLFTPVGGTPSAGQNGDYTLRTRDEIYYYPTGVIQQRRPQDWERQHHKYIFTAQSVYDFADGGVFNLNLLYQPHNIKQTDTTPYTSYTTSGAALPGSTFEHHQNYNVRQTREIGTGYERKIGPGNFNLIGIHSRLTSKTRDFRNRTSSAGLLTEVSKNTTKQNTGEDVLRGSYNWPVFRGQTLTLGAEGAKNTLIQNQYNYADLNRDGRQDFAALVSARVRERRGELFAIHNWTINPKLSLESSLSYEASQISTNYPQIPTVTYRFLKPRFDLRYNLTPQDRLRFKAERSISQLNFSNFVPAYNAIDSRIDAGNPAISPEQTWTYEAGIEHRLDKDQGSIEARGFYKNITDHIDRGPFGVASNGLPSSAPINIDSAKAYGLELKAGVRLTLLGLPTAQLNGRYQIQDSHVDDPFTGRDRMIYNLYRQELTLGFRHDLRTLRASYGATLLATDGSNLTSDIRTLQYVKRDPRVSLFVEKALPHDLTLRGEIYNLTGSHESSFRALYTVSQANGTINRTETYKEVRDVRYVLRLRGKF